MPLSNPTTVTAGATHPVLASQLDDLLKAADERLAVLYGSRTWFAFDLGDTPAHQIPTLGIVYVLTADASRVILPTYGTAGDGFNWPSQYVQADHDSAAAALTVTGLDALGTGWDATGTYSVGGYSFGESKLLIERTATADGSTYTLPVRLDGAFEPERFVRYALADVFIEDDEVTEVTWDSDRCGVARIHNVGRGTVTVLLGGGQSLELGPWEIRTIRRLGRTEPWRLDAVRRYFPEAVPGDVPMWDASRSGWLNQVLRSQTANPIFRVALVQSMFRPEAVSYHGAGMFSAAPVSCLAEVASDALLAELVAEHGTVEVVQTKASDASYTLATTITYDGTVSPTPSAWTDIGLRIVLDDSERGARVEYDPDSEVEAGVYQWDIISRGSNLTGGIIVEVAGDHVSSCPLRPFFASASDADDWYADLFHWPEWGSSKAVYATVDEVVATWVPYADADTLPNPNPASDYAGAYSTDSTIEHRTYRATWAEVDTGSIAIWNLWVNRLDESLPATTADESVSGASLVRQTICTAVCLQEMAYGFSPASSEVLDDACPIDPVVDRGAAIWEIAMNGQPVGLGGLRLAVTAEEELNYALWAEPRWRLHLFPTIGYDPQRDWHALGFRSSEELVWTPLHLDLPGAGTICHFRVRGAEGSAFGAPWTWSYGATTNRTVGEDGAPAATVGSGMTFWRLFWMGTKVPTDADTFPGVPATGPQPWKARDHGWLADEVLAGGTVSGGETWREAKGNLYDGRPITGGSPGMVRPAEAHVGMQLRMAADTFNQVAVLVLGITHVRPCGFERFVDGFNWADLNTSGGWDLDSAMLGASALALQPAGCAHVYGVSAEVDGILDGLGVSRRTATCAELQAMATVDCLEYYDAGDGYEVQTFTRPAPWSDLGGDLEWCSAEDISDALAADGWVFDFATLAQQVSLELIQPGDDETVVDTFPAVWITGGSERVRFHSRPRVQRTALCPVPVPFGDAASYQLRSLSAPTSFRIAARRPFRQQVMTRDHATGDPYPDDLESQVIQVRDITGDANDALNRIMGEFAATETGPGTDPTAFWDGTLVANPALSFYAVAVPWRDLLYSFTSGAATGSAATTSLAPGISVEQPAANIRMQWLGPIEAGGAAPGVSRADLGVDGTPAFPDLHHMWEVVVLQRRPVALADL